MSPIQFTALSRILLIALVGLLPMSTSAGPKKSETELIEMLGSKDPQTVIDALDRLPNLYPASTNAIQQIRKLLGTKVNIAGFPPNVISRRAARALGNYHATLDWDDLKVFLGFIRSPDVNEVMDGLKALRGLKEPREIEEKLTAEVVLLLNDKELHVVRDAIRTLGALGNKATVPAIEPFLKHQRQDVKRDAKEAIAVLEKKARS